MLKVLEYLDKNFDVLDRGSSPKNWGEWEYINNLSSLHVTINNETLLLRCKIDDKYIDVLYGYLQTYQHIPRGEPDRNGYYRRSTDEEVIKYINTYLIQVDQNFFRSKKLKNIYYD
jgi:hypothetical protein